MRRIGQVVRKGDRWMGRVSVGTKADGTRRTKAKTFDRKSDAEAWVRAMSVDLSRDGELLSGLTYRKIWEVYEVEHLPNLAPTTQRSYRYAWGLAGDLADRDPRTVSHTEMQAHLDVMRASVARYFACVLSSMCSYAVRKGMISENPLRRASFSYARPDGTDYDEDPFGRIDAARRVWDVNTIAECLARIRGLALEVPWLCCVGAGLRVEEAFALRGADIRRAVVGTVDGVEVEATQLAVHAAVPEVGGRKATKTRGSVRIATMLEPFGARLWEIAGGLGRDERLCKSSPMGQNETWRRYFDEPPANPDWSFVVSGRLSGLPYIPLSRMRATHETLMQEAGVLDSLNAAMHGHTREVAVRHYMASDGAAATLRASRTLGIGVRECAARGVD